MANGQSGKSLGRRLPACGRTGASGRRIGSSTALRARQRLIAGELLVGSTEKEKLRVVASVRQQIEQGISNISNLRCLRHSVICTKYPAQAGPSASPRRGRLRVLDVDRRRRGLKDGPPRPIIPPSCETMPCPWLQLSESYVAASYSKVLPTSHRTYSVLRAVAAVHWPPSQHLGAGAWRDELRNCDGGGNVWLWSRTRALAASNHPVKTCQKAKLR